MFHYNLHSLNLLRKNLFLIDFSIFNPNKWVLCKYCYQDIFRFLNDALNLFDYLSYSMLRTGSLHQLVI